MMSRSTSRMVSPFLFGCSNDMPLPMLLRLVRPGAGASRHSSGSSGRRLRLALGGQAVRRGLGRQGEQLMARLPPG